MRYLLRTTVGLALITFCLFALGYSIFQLLQIGTCASGGPYVSARQCPDGTAALGLLIPGAIILLLIGAAIYAGRGKAPGSDRPPNNGAIVLFIWTGIFWSIAAGCFLGVWGPEANPGPGGKQGGLIVGFLFVPMGAMGLFALKIPFFGKKGAKPTGLAGLTVPGSGRVAKAAVKRMPGLDPVARLEKLQHLREQGVVTDAEFERLKQEILSKGGQ